MNGLKFEGIHRRQPLQLARRCISLRLCSVAVVCRMLPDIQTSEALVNTACNDQLVVHTPPRHRLSHA